MPREIRKPEYIGASGEDLYDLTPEEKLEAIKILVKKFSVGSMEHKKILEVGSGDGSLVNYAKSQGLNMMGVDVRPRREDKSSQVIARIEQLPFPDESFEVIFSYLVFDSKSYIQDHELMVQDIARVLKKGGIYIY